MKTYDAIVVGMGAMGGAAAWQLAQRGQKVLGLEQFEIGHARGSSHGESRLIRQAYFEHPAYVPLLKRSYELWRDLEKHSGKALMHLNGLMIYGPPDGGRILPGVRTSSQQFGIKIQEFDAKEAATAYPDYTPPPGYLGILEPNAGFLLVEECVKAQAEAARRAGAEIRERIQVLAVREEADGVVVETNAGPCRAKKLVITAGAWSAGFLPRAAPHLKVHRVSLFWFEAKGGLRAGGNQPCFGFDLPEGFFYGLPEVRRRGVKVGLHVPGDVVKDPLQVDRSTRDSDVLPLKRFVAACLTGLDPAPIEHVVCLYTMTPDEHFIVDRQGRITYAAGFSGHGFKFSPVIGEVLADLATAGETRQPVDFLRYRW